MTWKRLSVSYDVARIEANSERRADRLERMLMRAAPESRLIRREEQGMEEALEAFREEGQGASESRDAERRDLDADPNVAAVMQQLMSDYEQRWVDESIPALGGMTPRQALGDPEMRRELEALLDDMYESIVKAFGRGVMVSRREVETDRSVLTVPAGVLLALLG